MHVPPPVLRRKRASGFSRLHVQYLEARVLRCLNGPDVAVGARVPHQHHILRTIYLETPCRSRNSESLTGKRNTRRRLACGQCEVGITGVADDHLYLPGQIVDLQIDHAIALESVHLQSGIGADVCSGGMGLTKALRRNCGTCQGFAVVVTASSITREYWSCDKHCCTGYHTNNHGSHNDLLVGVRANNFAAIVTSSSPNTVRAE